VVTLVQRVVFVAFLENMVARDKRKDGRTDRQAYGRTNGQTFRMQHLLRPHRKGRSWIYCCA